MGLLLLSMPSFFAYALAILAISFGLVLLGHFVLHFLRDLRDFKDGY
jgi:hypothetical protein